MAMLFLKQGEFFVHAHTLRLCIFAANVCSTALRRNLTSKTPAKGWDYERGLSDNESQLPKKFTASLREAWHLEDVLNVLLDTAVPDRPELKCCLDVPELSFSVQQSRLSFEQRLFSELAN